MTRPEGVFGSFRSGQRHDKSLGSFVQEVSEKIKRAMTTYSTPADLTESNGKERMRREVVETRRLGVVRVIDYSETARPRSFFLHLADSLLPVLTYHNNML